MLDDESPMPAVKFDAAKPRYSLIPDQAEHAIVLALEYGAQKYAPENWRKLPNLSQRYYDALRRHLYSWRSGERCDRESGLPHLAHAGACLLFLLAHEIEEHGGSRE